MFRFRPLLAVALYASAAMATSCQSPTSASDTVNVNDYVTAVTTPSTALAVDTTDGRTYRVVRGNNQPDEVLPFKYTTTFAITLTVTSKATDKSVNLTFPLTITAATAQSNSVRVPRRTNSHPTSAIRLGTGYSHIRNGITISGRVVRRMCKPMI